MQCKDVKEAIHILMEENIEESKKKEIDDHLKECKNCREEYEFLKNSVEALKGVKIITPPADRLWGKISKKLSEKEKKPAYFFPSSMLIPVTACMILIIFLCVFLEKTRKENIMNSQIKEIYSFMTEDNYNLALEKTQKLIGVSPPSRTMAELMLIKGKCYEKLGNKDEALRIYKEITEKFPRSDFAAESYYLTGVNYEKGNNLIEAVKNYSKAVDNYASEKLQFFEDLALRFKTCETILAEQEAMLSVRGDNKQEKTHQENLKKISDIIDKSFPDKKESLEIKEAELFIDKEEFQKALDIGENLLKSKDEKVKINAILIKGESLYGQGKLKEAEIEFKKIISDYPNSVEKEKASYYLKKINSSKSN